MQPTKHFVRGAVRTLAFATVALAALPALAGPKPKVTVLAPVTAPTGGPVRALSGTLSPFGGTLSPFSGTLSPFSGTLSPFYGTLSPFYGTLSPFSGTLSPFSGTLSPFSGTLSPFSGTLSPFSGTLSPFWGDLTAFRGPSALSSGAVAPDFANMGTFWNGVSTQWGGINTSWAASKTNADYAGVAGQLNTFVSNSESFWGAAVKARTGKSFNEGFAKPLFAQYGIDLADPNSLSSLSQEQRSRFLVDWFDGLMDFAGVDHVDHWMSEVNWNPALTQIQGAGSNTVIGLLDFTARSTNITKASGISTFSNGHGTAVASLIVAPHDGEGVMGIAPRASVVAYNPFDSTGTTNWADVTTGAITLEQNNASIINASLGVPGYTLHPDWNTVLTNKGLKDAKSNVVFVISAGNDGISQATNVEWDKNNAKFLVVGSIDPTLNISAFSNRPGTACLTDKGKCNGDYLMNHFIVASGENILVETDDGGLNRLSGTSFAAPLVSGAIALLHDRWPWLADHPVDTINIITKSAKDLGAPGVDPVYGVGLLDVTASQSPLSYDALTWYSPKAGAAKVASMSDLVLTTATALRDPKQQATWEASSVYVYGYEQLQETFRDFAIPLSSKLIGQSVLGAQGQQEQLQSYLTAGFKSWATPVATSTAGKAGPAPKKAFLNFSEQAATPLALGPNLSFTMSATPTADQPGWKLSQAPSTKFDLSTADGANGLKFGSGEGAAVLGGVTGFAQHSDYDPQHGGGNPLLGFASGGAYGAAEASIAPGLKFSAGVTVRDQKRDLSDMSGRDRLAAIAAGRYKAEAGRMAFTWRATDTVQLVGGYTHLREDSGLLGVQSSDPRDLGKGSQTDGFDAGADVLIGRGLSLSATGTVGRTRAQDAGTQNLTVDNGGVTTSSYAFAVSKAGLFTGGDHLRLSIAQPMHTESGKFRYTGVQVVDRSTGELGVVSQTFDATQNVRPMVAELLYARSVLNGAGELGVFGRAETRGLALDGTSTAVFMTGAKLRLRY